MTSKYRRLSSCGIALIPGTLSQDVSKASLSLAVSQDRRTYGSAIRRSVSFTIRFGNAAIMAGYTQLHLSNECRTL